MGVSGPTAVFFSSLTAIPISYMLNKASSMTDPRLILLCGVLVLVFVTLIPYLTVKYRPQKTDSFFYVLSIFTFSSVIDLVIALENDGIIGDFMAFYLREGEPYLKTAYGTMIAYWDGVAHYAMYLTILAAQSWGQSYREVGLYWAGSIGHSMFVFMPGILMGEHGIRWPCLLNLPYLIIPVLAGAKFLRGRPQEKEETSSRPEPPSIWRRPMDMFLILYLAAASVLAIVRFIAATGGNVTIGKYYLEKVEPYMSDPSLYPKVQMMVYLFYFLPYYGASIYGLIYPGEAWMSDWSLLHAGAAAQGQFSYIGASLHNRTPYIHRVPQNSSARLVFWLINLTLFLVPQVLAYRCLSNADFFKKQIKNKTSKASKKKVT
ncbi:transmembrane 6 superfamily member 1-like isoform X1 [Haliotis rufescens]|uniref:transmembrane 6 superfamily member 1-like isoform X1 n=1 Tax=Haliotis rufescens TaxID=6454 RepID=UPI00201EF577|nr:transmembrane 6 superfamily member 1-like isoform X1 [Haliotis rufescens]